VRRALSIATLAALAVAAACNSTPTTTIQARPEATAKEKEDERLARRPYVSIFDALEKAWLPGGTFETGVEVVFAPIHSGLHATLFYVAARRDIPRHVHLAHEETLFVYEGSGSLLLANGKSIPLEPGVVVQIPPGVCHGLQPSRSDPIKGIAVVGPALESDDWQPAVADVPGTTAKVYSIDATSPAALPPLEPNPDSQIQRKFLHDSKWSTLQVAAVRRGAITDHKHKDHDETVIIFAQAGLGFMRLNEVVHIVQPGSIAHAPAGSIHSFEHQAEGHARAISIFTPGHDGTDVIPVNDNAIPKAPQGYKVTERGEFTPELADPNMGKHKESEQIEVGPGKR
jgi:quercetin dioxygenase-like cupin family protein